MIRGGRGVEGLLWDMRFMQLGEDIRLRRKFFDGLVTA